MKPLLAPLACGTLTAALLYGLLWAAERKPPVPEDRWLEGWINDGMKADFRSTSTEPDKHLLATDARELFRSPDLAGTVVRSYIVQNTPVQVLELPMPGLLPAIPEGRQLDYRFKPKGSGVHLSRAGRLIALVRPQGQQILFIPLRKTTRPQIQAILESFEETAKRYP